MCRSNLEPLPGYCHVWTQLVHKLKEQNVTVDFTSHERFLKSCDEMFNKYDLFIFHDFINDYNEHDFSHFYQKSFLIAFDSIAIYPKEFESSFVKKFAQSFTWHDGLVDHKTIHKFHYPVLREYVGGNPFNERLLSCMVATNKAYQNPYELFSERINIIEYLNQKKEAFHLFGKSWLKNGKATHQSKVGWYKKPLDVYKRAIKDKLDLLKKYTFIFCLENSVAPGYVTEKIFDAFSSGCIPIYKGAQNISSYIPKNCYILYDDFDSMDSLLQYLKNFTEQMYLEYLQNIQQFLSSQEAQKFASKPFFELLYSKIETFLGEIK